MPIYPHSEGKWRVRVWFRGRKRDWVVEGKKEEARRFETARRAELERGDPVAARVEPTFSDFCLLRYRPHAETTLRSNTWANRKYELATLIGFFGKRKLHEITTDAVHRFREERVHEGLAPRSVNNELMALAAVLSFAREIQATHAKPKIEKLRAKQRRHAEAWTANEMQRLFSACATKDPKLLPIVVFIANTGLRKTEAVRLPRAHVDFDRGLALVWPHDEAEGFDTKSGKGREVPVPAFVLELVAGKGEWLFQTRSRRPFAEFPDGRFTRVVKAAGLRGGPHKLRHTYASHFLARNPDLFLLGRIMGHSHARVTELYGHLLPNHLDRARGAVELSPFEKPSQGPSLGTVTPIGEAKKKARQLR